MTAAFTADTCYLSQQWNFRLLLIRQTLGSLDIGNLNQKAWNGTKINNSNVQGKALDHDT